MFSDSGTVNVFANHRRDSDDLRAELKSNLRLIPFTSRAISTIRVEEEGVRLEVMEGGGGED